MSKDIFSIIDVLKSTSFKLVFKKLALVKFTLFKIVFFNMLSLKEPSEIYKLYKMYLDNSDNMQDRIFNNY